MFLSDEHGLLLGDVAVVLGPGLVGDGLTNDVDGPRHGLANLDGDNLKAVLDIVADQPWLHWKGRKVMLCIEFCMENLREDIKLKSGRNGEFFMRLVISCLELSEEKL